MNSHRKSLVLRLRNIPNHMDRLEVTKLLSSCTIAEGTTQDNITVFSIAQDVNTLPHTPRKVATLSLESLPELSGPMLRTTGVKITVPGLAAPLVLDSHFRGITPLNDVPAHKHTHDCFVISGLGSHPFGSWQSRGNDKSFMWIRDELPNLLPGLRFLVYGYDTTLSHSGSFQTTVDLGNSFNAVLRSLGCSEPSSKPIVFLAHSLGGVLLKQSLIALANGYERDHAILAKMQGAMLFGVPSQGMSVKDLSTMIGSQPNIVLLDELSDRTDFLSRLEQQFRGISELQKLHYCWAYETKTTQRLEIVFETASFARVGEPFIMVSRESATGGLHTLKPYLTLQIDENHSDMVKFTLEDDRVKIIASKLQDICSLQNAVSSLGLGAISSTLEDPPVLQAASYGKPDGQPQSIRSQVWDHRSILLSLRAPERHHRLEQIDERVGNTFDWAFDDDSIGLSDWLLKGSGLFWIWGKPGSGKSTFMKYLYQDERTAQLLRASSIKGKLTVASFFFHHRGNHLQKSFEGLLRSLVSQILEQEELLFPNVYPILERQFQHRFKSMYKTADTDHLRTDIRKFFRKDSFVTSAASSRLSEILHEQLGLTTQRCLGAHLEHLLRICAEPDRKHNLNVSHDDDLDIIHDLEPVSPKIQRILQRHYTRVERIRKEVESCKWTRDHLQETLQSLISQEQVELNLLLILDALDEYDGGAELIASVLKDLITTQVSSTRLRILFSSRPWKVFSKEFAATPGFAIHDYTRNDIEELCATRIPQNDIALRLLSPFIPEIVDRARGVFIWVKLVIAELSSLLPAAGGSQMTGVHEKLSACLNSLPDELSQFYLFIIQRIPQSVRWDTYVIMEAISRSNELLKVGELFIILRLSRLKSMSEARRRDPAPPLPDLVSQHVETASGGLVQIIKDKRLHELDRHTQLMHQSVQDFVQTSNLKSAVLGDARARLVPENGYSFLTKYYFFAGRRDGPLPNTHIISEQFRSMARQAEHTTGRSQLKFFQSEFEVGFDRRESGGLSHKVLPQYDGESLSFWRDIAEFAILHGLQLCLEDVLKTDPQCISGQPDEGKPDLISFIQESVLHDSANEGSDPINVPENPRFDPGFAFDFDCLSSRGMSIDTNVMGLARLFEEMFVPRTALSAKARGVAKMLLRAWTPSMSVQHESGRLSADFIPCSVERGINHCGQCHSLRLMEGLLKLSSLPDGTSALLRSVDCGLARPRGTPLDQAVDIDLKYLDSHDYPRVCLLVRLGGRLRYTSREKWSEWVEWCSSKGLRPPVCEDGSGPSWIVEDQPPHRQSSEHKMESTPPLEAPEAQMSKTKGDKLRSVSALRLALRERMRSRRPWSAFSKSRKKHEVQELGKDKD